MQRRVKGASDQGILSGTGLREQLTRVSVAIQVSASSKGRAKEVWSVASCPEGQQHLGRLRAQPHWAPREYKHHALLGLPTKGSPDGHICKTHNTHQSAGLDPRVQVFTTRTQDPGSYFSQLSSPTF